MKEEPGNVVFLIIIGLSILSILLAAPVAFWPHYEKAVYENAELPEDVVKKEITGLSHTSDEEDEPEFFSFEVDAKDLKPTGFYVMGYQVSHPSTGGGSYKRYRASGTRVSSYDGPPSFTWSWFEVLFYRKNCIYTQLYSLKLADGNTVLVQLGDTGMDIPSSGKIEIPVASWKYLSLVQSIGREEESKEAEKKLIRTYQLETDSMGTIRYIDASYWWMGYNYELIDLCKQRQEIFSGMIVCGIFAIFIDVLLFAIGSGIANSRKQK